jgi:hypothetical protein
MQFEASITLASYIIIILKIFDKIEKFYFSIKDHLKVCDKNFFFLFLSLIVNYLRIKIEFLSYVKIFSSSVAFNIPLYRINQFSSHELCLHRSTPFKSLSLWHFYCSISFNKIPMLVYHLEY